MNLVTKIFDSTGFPAHHDRGRVVGKLTLGFGVDTVEVQVGPSLGKKIIEIPFMVGGDGHSMGNFVDNVELFDANRVNLVEDVQAWNYGGGLRASVSGVMVKG